MSSRPTLGLEGTKHLAMLIAMVNVNPAWASESVKARPAYPGDGVLSEVMLVLVGIIVLIGGLGWVVRRFGNTFIPGATVMKVVGGISLGPKERIVLIEVGEEQMLVSVSPNQVRLLRVLDTRVQIPVSMEHSSASNNFTEIIKKVLQR